MAFEARVAEEAEKERLGHEVHAQPLPASSAGGHHHHSHSPQQVCEFVFLTLEGGGGVLTPWTVSLTTTNS